MKKRADVLLVERGLCESREQAQRLILAGEVYLPDRRVEKPGLSLGPDAELTVRGREKYVGRGGRKLEGALEHFGVDPAGRVWLDAGASTGGFTDCLLQQGAKKVYAVDVGTNQLAWKMRSDPRVVSREQVNARGLRAEDFEDVLEGCVMDLSFISLTLVLPAVCAALAPGSWGLSLIKPQFELERTAVGRGGIVKNPEDHARAVEKIRAFVAESGAMEAEWVGVCDSPILGTEGNKEFFGAWRRR